MNAGFSPCGMLVGDIDRILARVHSLFSANFTAQKASSTHSGSHSFSPVYTRAVEEPQPDSNIRPAGPALRFVAAALIMRGGEVLIAQRRADQPMALQWEFPGGKIEAGESPEQALARELDEELGIKAVIGPRVTRIRHNYRHGGAVDLQFFTVHEFSGEIENRIFQQVLWTRLEDLPTYDFLTADRGLIRDLAAGKLL
jgi:8-oxo-dGTP diphosphatase